MNFADRVVNFHKSLSLDVELPKDIKAIDPYDQNEQAFHILSQFYRKFYNDSFERKLILGINPGRLGAGITGVPFTDTKRLSRECGIDFTGMHSHEPSSVFVYGVIAAYGGVEKFYRDFYINSVCPVGFVNMKNGRGINYNYYDNKELTEAVKPFIIISLMEQVSFNINTSKCYCLGTGKNYKFLSQLNKELQLFQEIIPLEHPRYVVQYKSKNLQEYIEKYISAFNS